MTTTVAAVALAADALEANRQGRLADDQRTGWTRADRNSRSNLLFFAAFATLMGVLLLPGVLSNKADPTRYLGGLGFLVAAVVCVYFALFRDRLEQDLRGGRVESVEGPIGRDRRENPGTRGAGSTFYWLEIGGHRYECGRTAYDAAAEPGIVRLYFLPRTHKVVNFERLPDRPLPAGALTGPATLESAVRGVLSHDRATRDEAMATMAAIEHATFPGTDAPASGAPDARPLAEAIVGTWRGPMVEATFSPDGSATVSVVTGMRIDGHWSVDGSGKLVLDAMGRQTVTDTHIAGDVLTVTLDGTPMALRRGGG